MSAPDSQTPDPQKTGADPRASAFVSANAGSGKTRVLVDRVARILLEDVKPARILCLTFTKAAASEMQDRLFQRLGEWAIESDATLDAQLRALTGAAQDLSHARRLFARALDTPGGLNVQTIHAFCERLLRSFPVEAGLDPGFTVLEESESARVTAEARLEVAQSARREPGGAAARAFDALAGARNDRAVGEAFTFILHHRHDLADLFARSGGLAPVLRALHARLGVASGDTAAAVAQRAWRDTPHDRLRAAARAMQSGGANDVKRAHRLLAALDQTDAETAWTLYTDAVRTGGARLKDGLCTKGVRTDNPDIVALFGERDAPGSECARIDAVQSELKAARCADLSGAALTLAHEFLRAYEARKARARALDFADLIHRARALLMDSRARDWVRFKLDGGVDHILVDEAQDNSEEQWDIVRALAEEFFSGAGASERERTLFAVGDEKQSIFGFQGAEPRRFRAERARYVGLAHDSGRVFVNPELATSFRSAPGILGAVDHVFADPAVAARLFAAPPDAAEPGFDIAFHAHRAHRADRKGVVEVWPALPAAEREDDQDPERPLDAPRESDPATLLAVRIAQRIGAMIASGASVLDKETGQARAMRAGDALILVRRRGAFFEETIRQLKIAGLPVAGADRMALTEQTAVKDLLALARFALLPEDDLSLAELLRSPFFQPFGSDAVITEQALYDLAQPRTGRLWDALRATPDPRFAEAKTVLDEVRAAVGVAAPYEFFASFLNRLMPEGASMTRRLHARLGPEAEDPVEAFLARALAHARRGAPSLQRFVAEIEAESADIRREMESARDEVRVMTVHGAKGLEAPVVFLPDTTSYRKRPGEAGLFADPECGLVWSPGKDDDAPAAAALREARDAKDDAEYLRLLYVALTRARDHLVVAGWRMGPRGQKNPLGRIDEGCWHELVEAGLRRAGAEEHPFAWDGADDPGPMLVFGAPPDLESAETRAPAADAPPEWTRTILEPERGAALSAPSRLLSPDGERAAARSPLSDERDIRYGRGSLIHKMLELLPAAPEDARESAGRAFLARRAELDDAAREDVLAATLRVLSHPDFAHVFGADSRAEIPVAGTLPNGLRINGAVDRLVVTPRDVLIVDFKTNRPPPARIEDADRAYVAQMAAYRAVLRAVFPDRAVRCALLWTDAPMLMEVPAALMDGALPAPSAA